MKDYKKLLQNAFTAVIENPVHDPALIQKYFSEDYTQLVDGKTLNFETFNRHMEVLKETMQHLNIQFKTLVQEGNVVFSNHLANGITKEGRSGQMQIIAEFRFNNDDRICYCDELTHQISGDSRDRDMGSRH